MVIDLHIPSFVCEMIQDQLENNNYKEVVEYVIQRRNEIESKKNYLTEQQITQLTNNWNELEEWVKEDKEKAMENFECGRCFNMFDILDKMKKIEEKNK